MNPLVTYVRRNFTTLVLWSVLAGFALMLAELLITEHYDGITQLIAPLSCGVGILLIAAALLRWPGRSSIAVLLLLLSLTGLFGAFEHFEEGGEEEGEARVPASIIVMHVSNEAAEEAVTISASEENEAGEVEGREGREGEEEGNPPPLAPLSLSGLSAHSGYWLRVERRREGRSKLDP
jgi:hypothetical protein